MSRCRNARCGEMVRCDNLTGVILHARCETLPAKDWMFAQDTLTTEFSAVDQAFAVGASDGLYKNQERGNQHYRRFQLQFGF